MFHFHHLPKLYVLALKMLTIDVLKIRHIAEMQKKKIS